MSRGILHSRGVGIIIILNTTYNTLQSGIGVLSSFVVLNSNINILFITSSGVDQVIDRAFEIWLSKYIFSSLSFASYLFAFLFVQPPTLVKSVHQKNVGVAKEYMNIGS